jgi:hypothetical protein
MIAPQPAMETVSTHDVEMEDDAQVRIRIP